MRNLIRKLRQSPSPVRKLLPQSGDFNPRACQQLVSVLADKSSSMTGVPIDQVNRGVADLAGKCADDPQLRECLHVQLVAFGGRSGSPLRADCTIVPQTLIIDGGTPLAEGILVAIAETVRHTEFLRKDTEAEILKPHFFLFSDGRPTSPPDLLTRAADCIHQIEGSRRGPFTGSGLDEAAVRLLQPLFTRPVHLLGTQNFAEFFRIISVSVRTVSLRMRF